MGNKGHQINRMMSSKLNDGGKQIVRNMTMAGGIKRTNADDEVHRAVTNTNSGIWGDLGASTTHSNNNLLSNSRVRS